MLKNRLEYIPHIVLLRSDKVFDALLRNIQNPHYITKQSFEELQYGVRDFYPNHYRLDEIEMSIAQEELQKSNTKNLNYNFDFMDGLFDEYLVIDGSKIYPKTEQLDGYMRLITKVSPSHIIGYKLAKYLHDKTLDLNDIVAFVDSSTPLGLKVDTTKQYADNHIHIKGAGYSPFNLLNLANYNTFDTLYTKEYLHRQPHINEFSFINNGTYSLGQIVDILKLCMDVIYGASLGEDKRQNINSKLNQILYINKNTYISFDFSLQKISQMYKLIKFNLGSTQSLIVDKIVKLYDKKEMDKAHLLEAILCFYFFMQTDDKQKNFVRLYVHCTNILRSYMVMSQNLGLAHFSEFSGANIRQIEQKNGANSAINIINSGTNFLHCKLNIKDNEYVLSRYVEDFYRIFNRYGKQKNLRFNFGLSSIKNRDKKIVKLNEFVLPSFYDKRKSLQNEALALDLFLRDCVYKNMSQYKIDLKITPKEAYVNKHQLRKQKIDLSSFVVAIDAVGKETHTPPEVFAPFFRYLRKQPKKLINTIAGHGIQKHHPRLVITAHAGEDFNNIISGMRAVTECVEYFGMSNRDRIGHAMSLGMSVQDWFDGQKTLLIYKGEHFDNLVWLSMVLKEIKAENSYLTRYILKLQDEALKLFRELYRTNEATVFDMYEAWQYRKNCPLTHIKQQSIGTLYWDYHTEVYQEMKNQKAKEIYKNYHFCNNYRRKSKEVMKLSKDDYGTDVIVIFEMLQDYLIDTYAKKGIIFETNPSSNVIISDIENYTQHPVFRFYPPKQQFLQKGEIFNKYGIRTANAMVTINSDDPAIFATSIQNEYENLLQTAINIYGCSRKEADDWLDDIRRFSISIFKENEYGQNN